MRKPKHRKKTTKNAATDPQMQVGSQATVHECLSPASPSRYPFQARKPKGPVEVRRHSESKAPRISTRPGAGLSQHAEAFRYFVELANALHLKASDQLTLLGGLSSGRYYTWKAKDDLAMGRDLPNIS